MEIVESSIIKNAFLDKKASQIQSKTDSQIAKEDKKLKSVCQDFESIFIYYMLKNMRDTIPKGEGLFKDGLESNIYQSMLDQEIAQKIATGNKNLKIGDVLYSQLNKNSKKFNKT